MRPTYLKSVVRRTARRGFAFTEILFAVMVLALGFIMIAAMFPVTIRQTQSTMEEATAATVGRGAIDYLQGIASEDFFPHTIPPTPPGADTYNALDPAEVVSLSNIYYTNPRHLPGAQVPLAWGTGTDVRPAYYALRGNFIDPRNPRVAWIPLYRRLPNSPFAQVFIVVLQSRNRDLYVGEIDRTGVFPDRTYSDLERPQDDAGGYSTLEPRRIVVGVQWDDTLKRGVATIDPDFRGMVASGSYLIIAKDPNKSSSAPVRAEGTANGRVYQLGNAIDEAAGTWELAPGGDMIRGGTDQTQVQPGDDFDLPFVFPEDKKKSAIAYVVGRGYTDPLKSKDGYSGPTQEIGLYTGFVYIPPANP